MKTWAKERVEVTKLRLALAITILGIIGPLLGAGAKGLADWFNQPNPPELTIKSPEGKSHKVSCEEPILDLEGTCGGSENCENVFVFVRILPSGPWFVVSMNPVGGENKWYAVTDLRSLASWDRAEVMVRACRCSNSYLVDPSRNLPGLPDKGLKGNRTLWLERGK